MAGVARIRQMGYRNDFPDPFIFCNNRMMAEPFFSGKDPFGYINIGGSHFTGENKRLPALILVPIPAG